MGIGDEGWRIIVVRPVIGVKITVWVAVKCSGGDRGWGNGSGRGNCLGGNKSKGSSMVVIG